MNLELINCGEQVVLEVQSMKMCDKAESSWIDGVGNGNSLQYSCLENPRDRGAWWAAIYGVAQSRTRLTRLSSSSRLVTTFLPRSKRLLISWLQSPSAVILEPSAVILE